MTPGAESSQSYYDTAAFARRTRARHRAEKRLKAYGQFALFLAALALVALLWSVVGKAAGALTESYIRLPVTLSAEEIDPKGERDPKTILRADFNGLTKSTLREAFPGVTGRSEKRELYDLVSGGAAFELAEMVSENPDLIGQTIEYDFLASDVSDLYLQGAYGGLEPQEIAGAVTITEAGRKGYDIVLETPELAGALDRIKQTLVREAARLRRQAALQDNGARVFAQRAEAAEDEEQRAENRALAEERALQRDALLSQADDLEARAAASGGTEKLSRNNISVLLTAGGGWFKITEISPGGASARAILPPERPVEAETDWALYFSEQPEVSRKVSDAQTVWLAVLEEEGRIDRVFNWRFFTASDSREPELAGIWGAAVGSFWTMLVTFGLAFPIGVLAAIYLEEFAPRNRFTDFVEVNINNLAAVPSIVFGLLGLAVFLGFFGVPRSAPLAGGLVLALMTLPTVIIASRASIRAVPPSIRDAALGLGASKLQSSFHHVLPLAMPGIMTGTIIGMAQALGETAPLILIGMVAFIVDVPTGITDSATALPVQVYRWSDFPERAFEARTALAILVLLGFLVAMNALAVFLRRRFERRW